MRQLKIARNGYILISILFYIVGVVLICWADIPRGLTEKAAGIILILYGVIKIIGYFSRDLYCLAFQYDFACGLFLIVFGVIILAVGAVWQENLPKGVGLLILLDSLLCVQTALDARRFGLPTWGIILGASILSGVCGGTLAVTNSLQVAGFALLAEGFMRQYVTQSTVHLSQEADRTDNKDKE